MQIGSNIRRLRLRRGWTLFDLARRAGVPEQNIRRYEKGSTPHVEALRKLASALQCSMDALVKEGK